MTTPAVKLLVGGRLYGGWESVRITRSIEAMAGSFTLDVFDRWADQQTPWPLHWGDECTVKVGEVPLITGAVDRCGVGFGKGAGASVTGRDATRNVVDCACDLKVWEFNNIDVLAFTKKLCAPYGINVTLQPGLVLANIAVPKRLSIDPGDTAATAIEHVCRVSGLLAVSDGLGGLVLTRAGTTRCASALTEGVNMTAGQATYDGTQRHHKVVVLGNHKGTDAEFGAALLNIRGEALDENVEPSRVTYVRPEGSVDRAQAKVRAQWEVAVRAARGETYSADVAGWQQADGTLWPLNHVVHLRSKTLAVDKDLLISGLTFEMSRSAGATTHFELRNPDAFLPSPVVKNTGGAHYWKEIVGGV